MKPSVAALCLLLASVSLFASCGNGSAKPTPGTGCALNSDCAAGLICTFGLCHSACVVNGDCPSTPTQQLCVESSTGADGGTLNVCQLPAELKCVYNSNCASPLICARDEQCRNQCQANVDCVSPQVCTDSKVCALMSQLAPGTNDVPVVTTGQGGGAGSQTTGSGGGAGASATGTGGGTATGTGGAGGKAGASGSGGAAGAASGTGGSACTGPQDQFSNVSQGDANPAFNSAVAVRNANTLFIFSGYAGKMPVDGGADAGTLTGFAIFVQTFDAVTGIKQGASKFLMSVPYGFGLGVNDVAVAPTGEIALLYTVASMNNYADALYMTVFTTAPGDGGTASLTVEKTVQLESVFLGSPRVIWQPSTQQFIVSWKYLGSAGWYARVRRYHSNGTAAGSAINAIPTYGDLYQPNQEDDAYVGVSGAYLGLGYQSTSNNWAYLTIVDSDGFQVGPIVSVSNGGVDNWVAAGGTSLGFVTMWTGNAHISGAFVPLTGTGSVLSDAGAPDGGAPLKTFSFTSTAATGKIINDDYGGANGVGAAFLENDGASFVYVTADGSKSYTEGTVLTANGAIQADISNFGGSFVVSLFNGTTHAAAATVSSCP